MKRLRLKRMPAWVRPFADLGTLLWVGILKLPPGSVCDMRFVRRLRAYPDGKKLVVCTPYGWWELTRRSSTCTRKEDGKHYCWISRGSLAEGTFTIGKKGDTCESGAGSVGFRDENGKDIFHPLHCDLHTRAQNESEGRSVNDPLIFTTTQPLVIIVL